MQTVFWACVILVGIQGQAPAAEVQVNVRPAEDQKSAAVAVGPAGGAVIVWSSYFTSVGRSNDILARRLDFSRGGFVGEEFQVNVTTAGNQTAPAVAMDGQGRFAVVWHGPGLDEEDIFLRLFQPDGNAITGELSVNLGTAGRQLYPSVAFADTNTLVVAWENWTTVAGTETASVCVQRLDPNGVALGDTISADTAIYGCRDPQVAADGAGRFAVVWWRERSIHPIVARLFGPDGVPLTDPFEVNTTSIATVTRPSIAMNTRGDFVIAWDGHLERASEDDIYARLYDPNGTPRGEPFVVNTIRAGAQQWPQVSLNEANEFVVVWEHDTGDLNATEIAARYFDPNGVPVGEQFQLNTYTLDAQRYPDVAMAGPGSYLAVWESNGQDGSGYGIFATTEPPLLWLPPAGSNVEP
jgi:hypothetical protein